jgi:hypothetical protein
VPRNGSVFALSNAATLFDIIQNLPVIGFEPGFSSLLHWQYFTHTAQLIQYAICDIFQLFREINLVGQIVVIAFETNGFEITCDIPAVAVNKGMNNDALAMKNTGQNDRVDFPNIGLDKLKQLRCELSNIFAVGRNKNDLINFPGIADNHWFFPQSAGLSIKPSTTCP